MWAIIVVSGVQLLRMRESLISFLFPIRKQIWRTGTGRTATTSMQ